MIFIKLKKTIYRRNKNKKIYKIILTNNNKLKFILIGNINFYFKKININLKLFTYLLYYNALIKSKFLYNKLKKITNIFIKQNYEKFKY